MDREELRAYRQQKLDKKVARLRAKAERLEQEATAKQAGLRQFEGDTAFFTQPATPASRFGRYREKLYKRFGDGVRLSIEADKVNKKADWMERGGAVVKGDAERKREAERAEQDKVIGVGSRVHDFCFGPAEVVKVNKKTYTLRFDSGGTFTRDKVYVKVLERKEEHA